MLHPDDDNKVILESSIQNLIINPTSEAKLPS